MDAYGLQLGLFTPVAHPERHQALWGLKSKAWQREDRDSFFFCRVLLSEHADSQGRFQGKVFPTRQPLGLSTQSFFAMDVQGA